MSKYMCNFLIRTGTNARVSQPITSIENERALEKVGFPCWMTIFDICITNTQKYLNSSFIITTISQPEYYSD